MFVKFCACSFDRHVTKPCKRTEKSICIIIDPIRTDCPPKTTDVDDWNGVELRFRYGCDIVCPSDIACESDRIIIQQSSPSFLMVCFIWRQLCSQCCDFGFDWNIRIQIQNCWASNLQSGKHSSFTLPGRLQMPFPWPSSTQCCR